jgi:type IV pilus assembly protein PilM
MLSAFKKEIVGVDISDNTIEVAHLKKTSKGFKIIATNIVDLKPNVVEKGRIVNETELSYALKNALEKATSKIQINDIVFGIPESQTYIHHFDISKEEEKDLDNIAFNKAERYLPLGKNDVFYTYKIISKTNKKISVMLVGVSIEVFKEWDEFFKKNKLDVSVYDIETLASFRGIFNEGVEDSVMIVDVGANTTNISVFKGRVLKYSYTSNIAGNYFDKNVAKELGLKIEEAKEKREKITLKARGRPKINNIFKKDLDSLILEIKQVIEYVKYKNVKEIKAIYLVGGACQNNGFDEYIAKNIKIPTEFGFKDEANNLVGAIGMALRGIEKVWDKKDPGFLRDDLEDQIKTRGDMKKTNSVSKKDINDRENILDNIQKDRKEKKERQQMFILVWILVLGAILIGFLFKIQQDQRFERRESIKSILTYFKEVQTFRVSAPIATTPDELQVDRISGRILTDVVGDSVSYVRAQQSSRRKIEKKLNEGEELWPQPINNIDDTEDVTYPIEFKWLIFSSNSANTILENEAVKLINDQKYFLSNIRKINIEETDNENIYLIESEITLSLNELVEIEEKIEEPIEVIEEEEFSTTTETELE